MKEILTIRQSEYDYWAYTAGVGVSGNQSLETLIQHIETSLSSQSEKPWDFYLWQSPGQRWDDNGDRLIEECNSWTLNRYEVCTAPPESKYESVVILYYVPVVAKVAIAA
jgi:hypothetical protein